MCRQGWRTPPKTNMSAIFKVLMEPFFQLQFFIGYFTLPSFTITVSVLSKTLHMVEYIISILVFLYKIQLTLFKNQLFCLTHPKKNAIVCSSYRRNQGRFHRWWKLPFFCHGDEKNGNRACTNEHLTTADQSVVRKAYLVSVL